MEQRADVAASTAAISSFGYVVVEAAAVEVAAAAAVAVAAADIAVDPRQC